MKTIKNLILCAFSMVMTMAFGQEAYVLKENIPYYPEAIRSQDAYVKERCKLDVYYPKDLVNAPVVVWFHGGGLKNGEKNIPEGLEEKGIVVVAVNYRMHPKVQHPVYIEDAAAAVAWVFKNISVYHGSADKIVVSGHSAGGYLASMVGLDKSYLGKHGIDADKIAGLAPLSGHTITHMTIREEMGIKETRPIVDKFSPLFHVRKDAPPMLLITGNRELELLGRYEEVAYFYRMMKVVGHTDVVLMELDGYGHLMVYPALPLLVNFVKEKSEW
ncbi:alpha/beta hydrolase [Zobellia uliginosa]|uniref:alpha/beta hydrolase n=1 Tax=Zobellia uliginosa TaxID=143224 RepID=UPI0026E2120F|nr:alpha/beta hydrolase [Zobellia uliginosa]MDO6516387.1 alpha/beta hydrolase [Zobellia uliginosa]